MHTVLYFGNVDMSLSRNKVFSEGLRQNGVEVLVCVDTSPGWRKYWYLYKKHHALKGKYDAVIVGYGGYVTVPLARLISRKPVIFDALCSFYETEILSRDALKEIPFRLLFVRFIDWISTRAAHYVLVETEEQKKFFIRELGVPEHKLVVVYTGVDDTVFKADASGTKYDTFTVLFRGRIMSESGVPTVVRAAKLLENENIDFLIIGHGCNDAMREFESTLEELRPKNVRHISTQLPLDELVPLMQKCHLSLGQFAKHERLARTIPHKCFESMVLKLPYVTARSRGVSEVLDEGTHCLMVPVNDPQALAEAIKLSYKSQKMAGQMAEACYTLAMKRFVPEHVVEPLLAVLNVSRR